MFVLKKRRLADCIKNVWLARRAARVGNAASNDGALASLVGLQMTLFRKYSFEMFCFYFCEIKIKLYSYIIFDDQQ